MVIKVKLNKTPLVTFVIIILIISIISIILLILLRNKPVIIVNGYTQFGITAFNQLKSPKIGEEIAVIKTSMGDIKIRLFPDVAPKTVENFKKLVEEGYYNAQKFDRVEADFLIQVKTRDEPGKNIDRNYLEKEVNDEYRHFTGSVGLATNPEGKGGSSFYIICNEGIDPSYLDMVSMLGEEVGYPTKVVKAYRIYGGVPRLDFNYTVFGQVFYGMDTAFSINKQPVAREPETGLLQPIEPIIIEDIEIVTYDGK